MKKIYQVTMQIQGIGTRVCKVREISEEAVRAHIKRVKNSGMLFEGSRDAIITDMFIVPVEGTPLNEETKK